MPLSRCAYGLRAVLLGCTLVAAPAPTPAAVAEFAALVLYFYLMEQPQAMNHTQDVVDANLKSADAINRKRLEIWQKEVAMAMMPPPQSCVTLALAKGLRLVDSVIPGQVNTQIQEQLSGILGNGRPVELVIERVRRHERRYCAESDRVRGRCTATGALPNGDLDAGLFLDTRGYTAEQLEAAKAFVDNLTPPASVAVLPSHLENSPQADQLRSYLLTYSARKAVARKVLATTLAERTRQNNVATTTGGAAARSAHEVLFDEVERRFGNDQWTDQVLKAPPGSLEREKLMLETWKMNLALRQYRQQQEMQALLATLVDLLTEQQAEEHIGRLTEAATRAKVAE